MAGLQRKSKKRSGASSAKQPEPLVFFLDHSLATETIAKVLRQAGATVELLTDHFRSDAEDEEWLFEVGKKGWIVLTKDDRIRYRATERAALVRAQVAMFTLASGNLRGEEMAQAFINALPRIHRFMAKHRPPFIAKITRSGGVSILFSGETE